MDSWSVESATPGVAAAFGRASGAPDCGVGTETPTIEGAARVGAC